MKPMGYWNIKENCIKESKKYNTIYELQRKCYSCYMGLKRNNWLEEAFPNNKVKKMGYWNYKENCINEVKKYKNKSDILKNNRSCYNALKRNGWLEELTNGLSLSKDYRNVNKPIHLIYVYEIKEYNTCYIGRTLNLHTRDLCHRRGRKHSDGSITYDALYLFCKNKSIEIPQPIILIDKLNGEESLIKEDEYLKYYQINGWNTLNIAKTGINSGSLGSVMKWDYNSCKEFSKNFRYKTELKEANYTCYEQCLKNNWFEEFGIIDKKIHPNGYWNNKENVLKESEKYNNKTDFIINSQGAYKSAKKHNWLKDISYFI